MMQVQHLVRARDPLSSVMAAEAATKFASGHCATILEALTGKQATVHDLSELTGLEVVQIARRLPRLKAAGKARVVQRGGVDLMRGGARVWEAL